MEDYTGVQNYIDKIVQATGIDLANKTDYVIKNALRTQAPLAYWLLSHFPFIWLSRLLRFEIIYYQQQISSDQLFQVKIYGKTIGSARIEMHKLIV